MGDVQVSGNALALFSLLLSAVVGALTYMFKLLLLEKDRALRTYQHLSDLRYKDICAERDFYRKQLDERFQAQLEGIQAVIEGIASIQRIIQQDRNSRGVV